MLDFPSVVMLPRITTIFPLGRRGASAASTKISEVSKQSTPSPSEFSDIAPPRRKYRDEVSVLRALSKCVSPHLGLPAYGCAIEPWLSAGGSRERSNKLAKAAGRNAARYVARTMLANDLTALVTEVPRIDILVPLQTGESIRKELTEGTITEQEAMERMLLLLAPKDAWALYKDVTSVKWDSVTLHRLLDLLCATNSGNGGANFFEHLPFVDRGSLPEPEELFYAAENRIFGALRNVAETPTDKALPTPVAAATDDSEVDAENLEVLQVTEPQLEKGELAEGESVVDEILLAEVSSWHKGCLAELLFSQHPDVLRTPAAYTAMIRGAARFGAADRAWEMAKQALNSSIKLPLCVYNDLLRCAYEYSMEEDIWTRLLEGFELLRASNLRPDALTFSSAFYSLYKSNLKAIGNEDGPVKNVADKALGLLEETKRLGIQPTLGLYANLLQTLVSTRISKSGQAYRLNEILADILSDVENNWDFLSRADVFSSVDDYEFASTALFCATVDTSSNNSIRLVQRVYDLVHTRCGDRRFLFRNSVDARGFYTRYLTTVMLNGVGGVNELATIYHKHRQIFHGNQRVFEVLAHRLKAAIFRWKDALENVNSSEGKFDRALLENLEKEASKAFETLGEMLFDFVAMSVRMPQRLPSYISDSLMTFSSVDPWVEIRTPLLPGRDSLRFISEAGCRSAHKAALAFAELIRCHESRLASYSSATVRPFTPLNTAELTALVRMSLHPTAFNTGGPDGQQTVAQRESNERALNCASDLLMLKKDAMAKERSSTSDVAAIEMLRSCWLTGAQSVTEQVWSLLEYLAGLKSISGRCVQHVFVEDGSFWRVLDAAEESLIPEGRTQTEAGVLANLQQVQIISAVRRKFKEHVASNAPEH
nr:pentatricopeptide repeat containing protein 3 [Hymenolepis microstoma]